VAFRAAFHKGWEKIGKIALGTLLPDVAVIKCQIRLAGLKFLEEPEFI